jgi:ABC-type amino acid transport substrate-binding protein
MVERLMRHTTSSLRTVLLAPLAIAVVACSGAKPALPTAVVMVATACADADSHVRTQGQLTLGTGDPATLPWWGGDPATHYLVQPSGVPTWSVGNPYSMEGFEAGVAYSIVNAMGYQPDQVHWVKTDFAADESAAVANVDFTIENIPIVSTDSTVVFSEPYLTSTEAVVSIDGNATTSSTKVTDLAAFRLGARAGSGGERMIDSLVHPTTAPRTAPDDRALVDQLRSGQVDAIVVETNVAHYVRDGSPEDGSHGLKDAVIVGEIAPDVWKDEYAFALSPDNALLGCVNGAIELSRSDGLIDEYMAEDLAAPKDAPVLR